MIRRFALYMYLCSSYDITVFFRRICIHATSFIEISILTIALLKRYTTTHSKIAVTCLVAVCCSFRKINCITMFEEESPRRDGYQTKCGSQSMKEKA